MPPATPPAGPDTEAPAGASLNERLRKLRAELQSLQTVLALVTKDVETRKAYAPYIERTCADIERLLPDIAGDDEISQIRNLWELMKTSPLLQEPAGDFPEGKVPADVAFLAEQIRQAVFLIGAKTIPERVNEWLQRARPGDAIPFTFLFRDEVPDEAGLRIILTRLALAPKALRGGLVDLEEQVIYRYAESWRDQLRTLGLIVAAAILCTAVVWGGAFLLEWQPLTLLVAWVAVIAGIVVHVGIGKVKRAREPEKTMQIRAPIEWVREASAKSGMIIVRLGLATICLFGLAFASGVTAATAAATLALPGFLFGYTLDSAIDVFDTSAQAAAERTVKL